jgi:predicted TIM-barrel fold metal-dependent hydrolase
MLVVDSQVHLWAGGMPSAHHRCGLPEPFNAQAVLAQMRAAGVDCAILAPPAWDPGGNAPSLEAAKAYPDQFAVTGDINWLGAPDPKRIETWRRQPGMVGLRLIFNTPEKQQQLKEGAADWIWEAAQRVDLPVMLLIPDGGACVEMLAQRYPGLRLCIDHLAIPRGAKNAAAFEHLPTLLALARFPNVSVKVGGLNAYSSVDAYPFPSLHGYVRQVYDAFGPERMYWASDITRMPCPWREVVTLFTEGMPWLSERDRQLIMGEAVCRWLGWAPRPSLQR